MIAFALVMMGFAVIRTGTAFMKAHEQSKHVFGSFTVMVTTTAAYIILLNHFITINQ